MYDSLLLSQGGGIVNEQTLSPRYAGSAALVIGIGGTGVRALWKLKQKVYEQIQPDDPNQDTKRYNHIQFLAIDSDETDVGQMTGEARIDKDNEFLNISDPTLPRVLNDQLEVEKIKKNPLFNWFDIDSMHLGGAQGAGGVRQIGRYLFFKKVRDIEAKIKEKIGMALKDQRPAKLDIYIYAGISGGTGSGTFLDTCYLLRRIVSSEQQGISAEIFGMFFLPDVPISKPAVKREPAAVTWNTVNGYAAMRELDYLAHLPQAGERFSQDYGPFAINTDMSPVDMCHLFSAKDAEGVESDNAFDKVLNTAADLTISYLCDVVHENQPNVEPPQTIRGSKSNIETGIATLKPAHGADLTYHIVGTCEAVIPMSQFLTYLACRLFEEMSKLVGRGTRVPIAEETDRLAETLGFKDAYELKSLLEKDMTTLYLDDYSEDLAGLASFGLLDKATFPQDWIEPKDKWIASSKGLRERNAHAITGFEDGYNFALAKEATGSSVAMAFKMLCEMAWDDKKGPYYAAAFLQRGDLSLQSYLSGVAKAADESAAVCLQLANGMLDNKYEANQKFLHALPMNKKKHARHYYECSMQYFNFINEREAWLDTAKVARKLSDAFDLIYKDFFAPLTDCLDSLSLTFRANDDWLKSPEATRIVGNRTHLVELTEIKPILEDAVSKLNIKACVNGLVESLIKNPKCWMTGNELALKKLVCKYMGDVQAFKDIVNTAVENFLALKYLGEGYNLQLQRGQLVDAIKRNIIEPRYDDALPMFWARETYSINQTDTAYSYCNISVPSQSRILVDSANEFITGKKGQLRLTGLNDRISIIRYYSGIPFYAYQGVTNLRDEYEKSANAIYGAGAHLYAKTGRGGASDLDWRNILPTPMPVSVDKRFFPNNQQVEDLYQEGLDEGVIVLKQVSCQVPGYYDEGSICYSDMPELGNFLPRQCIGANGKINIPRWTNERAALQRLLNDRINAPTHKEKLKSGVVKSSYDTIRKDYFFHYSRYQDLVHNELAARKALQEKLNAYDAFRDECERFDSDMKQFVHALFMGKFDCLDVQGAPNNYTDYLREVQLTYTDARGIQQNVKLAAAGDTGAFSAYPLYRAFEGYRNLSANKQPRLSLDAETNQHFKGYMRAGVDNRVAYTLQQYLTSTKLGDINVDSAQMMTPSEHNALMQFYTGLVGEVSDFAQLFTPQAWVAGGVIVPGEERAVAADQAPAAEPSNTPVSASAPTEADMPAPADAPANQWVCACGYAHNTGNFCAYCGNPQPEAEVTDGWICPGCHTRNTGNFCTKCGKPRPANGWTCAQCRADNDIASNFCPKCGAPRPDINDMGM